MNIQDEVEEIISGAERKTLYFGSPFAFYYFVREYDLEHFSIYDTCSIEVEPTIDKIIKMNEELKKYNVPVLYTKELLNDSIAKKVIEEVSVEFENVSKNQCKRRTKHGYICKNNDKRHQNEQ